VPDRLRIAVLGYVVRGPLGGLAWHHVQYVQGLLELGHDVVFFEDEGEDPDSACYDPSTHRTGPDPSYGLRFTAALFSRLGMGQRWAYYRASTNGWEGPSGERALDFAASADVLLNLSGVNPLRPWWQDVPVRVFVDTDPAFQQARVLAEPAHAELVRGHTSFFTFAANVGRAECALPDDGLPWQPTVQPVHLQSWRVTPVPSDAAFTTVMQWDSYERRSWNGVTYGMKAESFEPFRKLPARVSVPLELAIGSASAPREELAAEGWVLRDPLSVTRTPWSYQDFLAGSLGEFSVAKHGYVVSRSGWFSERSANYLASGRPVVVQDTGFGSWITPGEGLLTFSTPEEAVAALEEVLVNPEAHGRAARNLAESHFASGVVLTEMLHRCA
jgi:hypothetical protein